MAQIKIGIIDPSQSSKTNLEVPDDVVVSDLIPALIDAMRLPVADSNGHSIQYQLSLRGESGSQVKLDKSKNLFENNVFDNSMLQLSAEVTTTWATSDEFYSNPRVGEQNYHDSTTDKSSIGVLRISVSVPALLTYDEFLDSVTAPIKAIESLYETLVILYMNDQDTIKYFIASIKEQQNSTLQSQARFLATVNIEPLRMVSIHYGSPASFDLLGIGKILELVRDSIKDLAWRGKHEKQMADLERISKQAEITKNRLEYEKIAAEISKQKLEAEKICVEIAVEKLEIIEKMSNLRLDDEDKKLIVSSLIPQMIILTEKHITPLMKNDSKSQ